MIRGAAQFVMKLRENLSSGLRLCSLCSLSRPSPLGPRWPIQTCSLGNACPPLFPF